MIEAAGWLDAEDALDGAAPPPPPSPFEGRRRLLKKLDAAVESGAGVVLHSTAGRGFGRSALAWEITRQKASSFPGGVFWWSAEEDGLDPQSALHRWARVTGASLPASRELEHQLDAVRDALTDRAGRCLVVLDGVDEDHLELALALFSVIPGDAAWIVTADDEAGVAVFDGLLFDVAPMSVVEGLAMLRRAARFAFPQNDAVAVIDAFDRAPLGLRMAGFRFQHHPVSDPSLLAVLPTSLRDDQRIIDALPGNRALANAFFVLYRGLPEATQRVFRLLGVVMSPRFDAFHIAGVSLSREAETSDHLGRLQLAGLIEPSISSGMWRMHTELRRFAETLLDVRGEEDDAREQHLRHFVSFAVDCGSPDDDNRRRVLRMMPDLIAARDEARHVEDAEAMIALVEALVGGGALPAGGYHLETIATLRDGVWAAQRLGDVSLPGFVAGLAELGIDVEIEEEPAPEPAHPDPQSEEAEFEDDEVSEEASLADEPQLAEELEAAAPEFLGQPEPVPETEDKDEEEYGEDEHEEEEVSEPEPQAVTFELIEEPEVDPLEDLREMASERASLASLEAEAAAAQAQIWLEAARADAEAVDGPDADALLADLVRLDGEAQAALDAVGLGVRATLEGETEQALEHGAVSAEGAVTRLQEIAAAAESAWTALQEALAEEAADMAVASAVTERAQKEARDASDALQKGRERVKEQRERPGDPTQPDVAAMWSEVVDAMERAQAQVRRAGELSEGPFRSTLEAEAVLEEVQELRVLVEADCGLAVDRATEAARLAGVAGAARDALAEVRTHVERADESVTRFADVEQKIRRLMEGGEELEEVVAVLALLDGLREDIDGELELLGSCAQAVRDAETQRDRTRATRQAERAAKRVAEAGASSMELLVDAEAVALEVQKAREAARLAEIRARVAASREALEAEVAGVLERVEVASAAADRFSDKPVLKAARELAEASGALELTLASARQAHDEALSAAEVSRAFVAAESADELASATAEALSRSAAAVDALQTVVNAARGAEVSGQLGRSDAAFGQLRQEAVEGGDLAEATLARAADHPVASVSPSVAELEAAAAALQGFLEQAKDALAQRAEFPNPDQARAHAVAVESIATEGSAAAADVASKAAAVEAAIGAHLASLGRAAEALLAARARHAELMARVAPQRGRLEALSAEVGDLEGLDSSFSSATMALALVDENTELADLTAGMVPEETIWEETEEPLAELSLALDELESALVTAHGAVDAAETALRAAEDNARRVAALRESAGGRIQAARTLVEATLEALVEQSARLPEDCLDGETVALAALGERVEAAAEISAMSATLEEVLGLSRWEPAAELVASLGASVDALSARTSALRGELSALVDAAVDGATTRRAEEAARWVAAREAVAAAMTRLDDVDAWTAETRSGLLAVPSRDYPAPVEARRATTAAALGQVDGLAETVRTDAAGVEDAEEGRSALEAAGELAATAALAEHHGQRARVLLGDLVAAVGCCEEVALELLAGSAAAITDRPRGEERLSIPDLARLRIEAQDWTDPELDGCLSRIDELSVAVARVPELVSVLVDSIRGLDVRPEGTGLEDAIQALDDERAAHVIEVDEAVTAAGQRARVLVEAYAASQRPMLEKMVGDADLAREYATEQWIEAAPRAEGWAEEPVQEALARLFELKARTEVAFDAVEEALSQLSDQPLRHSVDALVALAGQALAEGDAAAEAVDAAGSDLDAAVDQARLDRIAGFQRSARETQVQVESALADIVSGRNEGFVEARGLEEEGTIPDALSVLTGLVGQAEGVVADTRHAADVALGSEDLDEIREASMRAAEGAAIVFNLVGAAEMALERLRQALMMAVQDQLVDAREVVDIAVKMVGGVQTSLATQVAEARGLSAGWEDPEVIAAMHEFQASTAVSYTMVETCQQAARLVGATGSLTQALEASRRAEQAAMLAPSSLQRVEAALVEVRREAAAAYARYTARAVIASREAREEGETSGAIAATALAEAEAIDSGWTLAEMHVRVDAVRTQADRAAAALAALQEDPPDYAGFIKRGQVAAALLVEQASAAAAKEASEAAVHLLGELREDRADLLVSQLDAFKSLGGEVLDAMELQHDGAREALEVARNLAGEQSVQPEVVEAMRELERTVETISASVEDAQSAAAELEQTSDFPTGRAEFARMSAARAASAEAFAVVDEGVLAVEAARDEAVDRLAGLMEMCQAADALVEAAQVQVDEVELTIEAARADLEYGTSSELTAEWAEVLARLASALDGMAECRGAGEQLRHEVAQASALTVLQRVEGAQAQVLEDAGWLHDVLPDLLQRHADVTRRTRMVLEASLDVRRLGATSARARVRAQRAAERARAVAVESEDAEVREGFVVVAHYLREVEDHLVALEALRKSIGDADDSELAPDVVSEALMTAASVEQASVLVLQHSVVVQRRGMVLEQRRREARREALKDARRKAFRARRGVDGRRRAADRWLAASREWLAAWDERTVAEASALSIAASGQARDTADACTAAAQRALRADDPAAAHREAATAGELSGRLRQHIDVAARRFRELGRAVREAHGARRREHAAALELRAELASVVQDLGSGSSSTQAARQVRLFERGLSMARLKGEEEGLRGWLQDTAGVREEAGDIGRARELAQELLDLVQESGRLPHIVTARALLARVSLAEGDPEAALEHGSAALDAARIVGDHAVAADLYPVLGQAHLKGRDLDQARENFEHALGIALQRRDQRWAATLHGYLARVESEAGDLVAAEKHGRAAVEAYQAAGHRLGETIELARLSSILRHRGLLAESIERAQGAVGLARQLDDDALEIPLQVNLGRAWLAQGRPRRAAWLFQEAMVLAMERGDRPGEAMALTGLAGAARRLARGSRIVNGDQAITFSSELMRRWRHGKSIQSDPESPPDSGHDASAAEMYARAARAAEGAGDELAGGLRRLNEAAALADTGEMDRAKEAAAAAVVLLESVRSEHLGKARDLAARLGSP